MDRRLGRARLERRELKEGLDMEPWLRICWYERSHGIRIPAVGGGGRDHRTSPFLVALSNPWA